MDLARQTSSESDSFEQLLAAHQGRLFGFIRALVGPGGEVDDILQNTNQILWREAETFEPGTNFRAWAFQVARHQVLRYRERRQREGERVPFSDELMETLAERSLEKESSIERRQKFLRLCLDRLPERQRDVVERRYFGGESVQGIASEVGLKPNAISQLLFRGRDNLLRCIESQLGDSSIRPLD
ncbi:MAG: sigma-70 family RNA polymerase sigma factor [Verrucomicrobiota bacterium]